MMIFVSVGNGKFERLIKEVDHLVAQGVITEKVVVQLGHGEYLPTHCSWFRFESPLTKYFKEASLVISHGGPGNVFEILRHKTKVIAVPNRDRTDPLHQVEFLRAISAETDALLYCDSVEKLAKTLEIAKTFHFGVYTAPEFAMHKEIKKFLDFKN